MGSRLGVEKIAAGKAGLTLEEYRHRIKSGLKKCTKCKTWKQKERFNKDNSRGDKLACICVDCSRVKIRKLRKMSPPNNKIQSQASSAVSYAIKLKTMKKAKEQPCFDCGEKAEIYHHHLGYARSHWLDVVPLCNSCHRKRHFE